MLKSNIFQKLLRQFYLVKIKQSFKKYEISDVYIKNI